MAIINKYNFPEKFDEESINTFECGTPKQKKKLREYGLICLNIDYTPFSSYITVFHHVSGASVVFNGLEENIYLVGQNSSINKAKKDLESLIGKLRKLKILKEMNI